MATSAGSQHRCVFVGNIPYDATEEQLIQICEEVGPVVSFRLVVDRETGKPKGYGFCEYKDEETALSARRNLQGYEINGRQLRVDFAENDKRADRSREQGRGGPGLTSSTDAQKALPGPSIPVDSALHQPVGHQLAATAASVMARTLGGAQTSYLPLIQNGLQNPSGVGNDPLTQYLAKMSRQQLNETMSEMKALVAQNKPLAQQLLQRSPQLSKALFQAEIMLGLVTPPQLMRMANTQQPSNSVPQPGIQNNISNQSSLLPSQQKEALVGPLTRSPELNMPKPVIPQHSAVPLQHVPVQPQFPQPQILQQGPIHGNSLIPVHPQPFGNLSNQPQLPPLPTSKGLISQVQPPPLLQHSRPGQHRQPPLPDSLQQSYLPHLPTSQNGSSNHPVLLNGRDSLSKDAGTSGASSHDSAWASRVHKPSTLGVGLTEQTGTAGDMLEVTNHPSKRPRLEDGGGAIGSVPAQSAGSGSVPGRQMVNADAEKQVPQLPPELESALLQQVLNLTPDQLSSLPLEQQQQVLQLQQMLVKQNL